MTSGQRKTHLIIWIILGIAIPILIVGSVLQIRTLIVSDGETIVSREITKGNIVADDSYFTIEIIGQGMDRTLKTTVKKPLKSPSVIAYGIKKDGSETVLGAIESKGVYTFPIDSETISLKVYDGIKSMNLVNITL